jgi:single-stranded-DNA-specific exonuclease
MEQAGVATDRLDLEDVAFALAPRLNAAGRGGEAARAARLLLTEDEDEALSLATEIDAANRERRDMTRKAIAEARRLLGLVRPGEEPEQAAAPEAAAAATAEAPGVEALAAVEDPVGPDDLSGPLIPVPPRSAADLPAALLIRGEWPVGIVGLVAGRLAEDLGRPAVVATTLDGAEGILRASCRSGGAFNMAEALVACSDLLIRHGGHQAAAGFDISAENWPRFAERFLEIAAAQLPPAEAPELRLDLVLPADSVDFDFVREMTLLEPTGPGNPRPTIGIAGLSVSRVRPAAGGHTQLVLRRSKDVLDAIAFRRADLAESLHEGDRIDVVARAASRRFGGFETIQLEVIDVSEEGARLKPGRGAGAEG